jgi:hypothetical protein
VGVVIARRMDVIGELRRMKMNKEQLKELDRIAGELKALRDDVENTDIPVEVTSTTEQDKWQRVIDEGYLCKFWDEGHKTHYFSHLLEMDDKFRDANGTSWYNCEVLREKGIKQPYFQGDNIPKFKDEGVLYHKDNSVTMFYDSETYADYTDWSEVIAYIEV